MTEFTYGQMVRLVLDNKQVGQIVGESNWGDVYLVRLSGSLTTHNFETVELLPLEPEPGERCGEVVDISDFIKTA